MSQTNEPSIKPSKPFDTAFLYYHEQRYLKICKRNPSLSEHTVQNLIAKEWKGLSESDRRYYEDMKIVAEQDYEDYLAKRGAYATSTMGRKSRPGLKKKIQQVDNDQKKNEEINIQASPEKLTLQNKAQATMKAMKKQSQGQKTKVEEVLQQKEQRKSTMRGKSKQNIQMEQPQTHEEEEQRYNFRDRSNKKSYARRDSQTSDLSDEEQQQLSSKDKRKSEGQAKLKEKVHRTFQRVHGVQEEELKPTSQRKPSIIKGSTRKYNNEGLPEQQIPLNEPRHVVINPHPQQIFEEPIEREQSSQMDKTLQSQVELNKMIINDEMVINEQKDHSEEELLDHHQESEAHQPKSDEQAQDIKDDHQPQNKEITQEEQVREVEEHQMNEPKPDLIQQRNQSQQREFHHKDVQTEESYQSIRHKNDIDNSYLSQDIHMSGEQKKEQRFNELLEEIKSTGVQMIEHNETRNMDKLEIVQNDKVKMSAQKKSNRGRRSQNRKSNIMKSAQIEESVSREPSLNDEKQTIFYTKNQITEFDPSIKKSPQKRLTFVINYCTFDSSYRKNFDLAKSKILTEFEGSQVEPMPIGGRTGVFDVEVRDGNKQRLVWCKNHGDGRVNAANTSELIRRINAFIQEK